MNLFTAHSYTGPWDSGQLLSASKLFGQDGYVLDCATQPEIQLGFLIHTRCVDTLQFNYKLQSHDIHLC